MSIQSNFLFIISAPSGCGKTTICNILLEKYNNLKRSVSVTTRNPRVGEIEGFDFYFINKEKYNKMIQNNEFLESADIFDNHYGTPLNAIYNVLNQNCNVLFNINWQGLQIIKQNNKEKFQNKFNIVSLFLMPPSIEVLKQRLLARETDTIDVVNKRLLGAEDDIKHANEYDYIILNDDINVTLNKIHEIYQNHQLNEK